MDAEQDHAQGETHDDESAAAAEIRSRIRTIWERERDPYKLCSSAVESGSVPELRECLAIIQEILAEDHDEYINFRSGVFSDALSSHSLNLITYMLDHEGIPVSEIHPIQISRCASKPLIEALIERGWDVNTQNGPAFDKKRLIDHLVPERVNKEGLARWLIEEKGARVDGGEFDPDYSNIAQPAPLLEYCAGFGTVPMFKFLEAKGAKHSRRMLHNAVSTAASLGADPDSNSPAQGPDATSINRTVDMLRYLVDERRLDINGTDSSITHWASTHWGTPICYAARWPKGASVVRWLLKKGADPTIKDLYPSMDAAACAREAKCDEVLQVLENWQRIKNEEVNQKASHTP
ncbi:hypothetical protein F5B20DRAFT_534661 [Whalleya microplaca]|nr:hypothetical protein F5B20DRAFT_534661 [Whalleya microplaca]